MTHPEGGVTYYTYDGLKRPTSTTNAFGEKTSYIYDALSRLSARRLPTVQTQVTAHDGCRQADKSCQCKIRWNHPSPPMPTATIMQVTVPL